MDRSQPSRAVELVIERSAPTVEPCPDEALRIVVAMDQRIEGCTQRPAPEPALPYDGQLDQPPVPAPIATDAETPCKLDLVTENRRPEPTVQSPRVEAPRIVVAMDPHPPEPELSCARVERR